MTPDTEDNARYSPHLFRCTGQVMQAWFRTEADLRSLVPKAFELSDPHRAFLKVYELKFGPVGQAYLRPAFSQYRQVGVTVMAAPAQQPPMHVNLFMWEERGWSMQSGGGDVRWHKKMAEIEITRIFPLERAESDETLAFNVDVSTLGVALMRFDGQLDGKVRMEPPPLNGFYFGGNEGEPVYALPLREPYLGPAWHGGGSLEFWASPHESPLRLGDWSAASLGNVVVEGFCVQDVRFLRDYRDLVRL